MLKHTLKTNTLLITLFLALISFNSYGLQILASDAQEEPAIDPVEVERLAKTGDIQAQFKLAGMYHTGKLVDRDDKLSFYWYLQVANKGYSSAQFNIANSYYNGIGVDKSLDESIIWYKKAANQGLMPAIYNLAFILENDKNDEAGAFVWYEKAAQLGHGDSQLNVAMRYQNGLGVAKNQDKARQWFKVAVQNQAFDSEYYYAEFLYSIQDYDNALKYYQLAADKDSILANYKLAKIYIEGKIVKRNINKATALLIKAANEEYAPAQQLLAFNFKIKKEFKKSVFWYEKAANNGNAKAQYSLGVMYLNGTGVKKDIYKSTEYFLKAANNGYLNAQYSLGIRYLKGDGIEQNYYEAIKWLTKAAAQNHPNAQYSLAIRYKLGQGVEKNEEKSILWLEKAFANNNLTAKYELASLTLLGKKTSMTTDMAVRILQGFAIKGGNFADNSRYNLAKFLLKTNPQLAKKYLLTASNNGHLPSTTLLTRLNNGEFDNLIAQNQQDKNIIKTSTQLNPNLLNAPQNAPAPYTSKKTIKPKTIKPLVVKTTSKQIPTNFNWQPNPVVLQNKQFNQQLFNPEISQKVKQISQAKRTTESRQANQSRKNKLKNMAESMYLLAINYLNNGENNNDYNSAFDLMTKSAKLGFPPAQNDLALMYFSGIGTPASLDASYKLALMSSKNGYLPANQTLIIIKNAINQVRKFN